MKKIQIQFSLEKYLNGGYSVETRGDRNLGPLPVRIICTDMKSDSCSIIGLIMDQLGNESIGYFNSKGNLYNQEGCCDLYLVKSNFDIGDIVAEKSLVFPYRGLDKDGSAIVDQYHCTTANYTICRPATEEEKQKFFNTLISKNKTWNSVTKQVEELYKFNSKDWCLMRNKDNDLWTLCRFSHSIDSGIFVAVGGIKFEQCIPYNKETINLIGTKKLYKNERNQNSIYPREIHRIKRCSWV
jgi:hypothetical protein